MTVDAASASLQLLPGVPIVESPFFEAILESNYFTDEEKPLARDLHDKGFAILRFPDADFDARAVRMRSRLQECFEQRDSLREQKVYADGPRLQDAWRIDADVKALACNARILALLQKLYGRPAFPFQTLNFRYGSQQHMHTDAVHFSSNPERFMCGIWVALEEVHAGNGPLFYYEGSHRWPIYTNEHIGVTASALERDQISQQIYHALWQRQTEIHGVRRFSLHAPAGTALIWASNLLHGGEAVRDAGSTRWSQVTHYYFDGCSYYTPMHSDVFLGKTSFRLPVNLLTGQDVPNTYNGHEVSLRYVKAAAVGISELPRQDLGLPVDFDGERYLALNPDVAAAQVDPKKHYLAYGWREGRAYK
jgi:hypothetical protein